MVYPHCSAIAAAMPGKVLLRFCFKRILKAIGRIVETGGPYLVHHLHFPCFGVFAAPIFSMLVVYWVWRKLFYNVAHFQSPFCLFAR